MKTKIALGVVALVLAGQAIAQSAVVRVTNRSSYDIYKIYTSPALSRYFGDTDLLGSGMLSRGSSKIIDFDVPDGEGKCWQDVLALSSARTGQRWEKRIDVCRETDWVIRDE